MKHTLALLLRLAEIDLSLDELNESLGTIPEAVGELERQIQILCSDQQGLERKMTELNAQKTTSESLVREKQEWITGREDQVKDLKTNKEYHAALKEIAVAKKEISDNESKATTLSEQLAEIGKQLDALKSANDAQITALKQQIDVHNAKTGDISPLIDEKRKCRDDITVGLDAKILAMYEQIRQRVTPAISKAENTVCTECGSKIQPQLYNRLFTLAELLPCPRCRRILYVEEFLK